MPFRYSCVPITPHELPYTYGPGCPVEPTSLMRLNFVHYDFSGNINLGSLVIHKATLEGVASVLASAFEMRYPIHSAIPLDHAAYKGDDDISMSSNNSSAFNYRKIAGTARLSNHSFGLAIDINPLLNPYLEATGKWSPPEGAKYIDRTKIIEGMLHPEHPLVYAFARNGFTWGGHWERPDYHHFEYVLKI